MAVGPPHLNGAAASPRSHTFELAAVCDLTRQRYYWRTGPNTARNAPVFADIARWPRDSDLRAADFTTDTLHHTVATPAEAGLHVL